MTDDKNRITPQESDEYDPITNSDNWPDYTELPDKKVKVPTHDELIASGYEMTGDGFWVGSGDTATEPEHSPSYYDYTRNDSDAKNPFTDAFDHAMAEAVVSGADPKDYPLKQNFLADNDDNAAHHFDYDTLNLNIHANSPYNDGWTRQAAQEELDKKMTETPSIKDPSNRKYKEDESIKALQDYISTTYGGHYTSKENNVQTLDLIESVGDAESFCRSNAIKYLSRYDKKGQANRDILKALHYTLLLYYFSGNTKKPEYTNSRYETF